MNPENFAPKPITSAPENEPSIAVASDKPALGEKRRPVLPPLIDRPLDIFMPVADQLKVRYDLAKRLDAELDNGQEENMAKVRTLVEELLPYVKMEAHDDMRKTEMISNARQKMNEACEKGDYNKFLEITKDLLLRIKLWHK